MLWWVVLVVRAACCAHRWCPRPLVARLRAFALCHACGLLCCALLARDGSAYPGGCSSTPLPRGPYWGDVARVAVLPLLVT